MQHVHEMIRDHYPEYYSIERYPAAQTICVRGTKEEWGIFGNFYQTPIVVNGVTFDCTERLFHMMKLRSDLPEAVQYMMSAKRGRDVKMKMKHIKKACPEWLHDHWPSMIADAMKFCLMLKYEQSEDFRRELERSKGKYIVEDQTTFPNKNADTWGTKLVGNEYVGPNLLGRLLMELRDNGKLKYTLPDGALDFINHLK